MNRTFSVIVIMIWSTISTVALQQ